MTVGHHNNTAHIGHFTSPLCAVILNIGPELASTCTHQCHLSTDMCNIPAKQCRFASPTQMPDQVGHDEWVRHDEEGIPGQARDDGKGTGMTRKLCTFVEMK